MKALCSKIYNSPELAELRAALEKGGKPVSLCGLPPVLRALLVLSVIVETGRPAAVITESDAFWEAFEPLFNKFAGGEREAVLLKSRELVFYDTLGRSKDDEHGRINALTGLSLGRVACVCGRSEAFLQLTIPQKTLLERSLTLKIGAKCTAGGAEYSFEEALRALEALGYARGEVVEGEGQYALRGGILDVYPAGSEHPVRAEFFGDEIDSMGYFDVVSQRRLVNVNSVVLPPASESCAGLAENLDEKIRALIKGLQRARLPEKLPENISRDAEQAQEGAALPAPDRYLPVMYGAKACALDYLPENAVVFTDEHSRLREHVRAFERAELSDLEALTSSGLVAGRVGRFYRSQHEFWEFLSVRDVVMLDSFAASSPEIRPAALISVRARQLPFYGGSIDALVSDVRSYRAAGFAVVAAFFSETRLAEVYDRLFEERIPAVKDVEGKIAPSDAEVVLTLAPLAAGFELTGEKLAVLSDGGVALRQKARKTGIKKTARDRLKGFSDLKEGDLVVHDTYGIGRFKGIVRMDAGGIEKDFIKLAYRGSDVLYLPVAQLDLLSKYLGAAEDTKVQLSKLGGGEWAKTKARAKRAAKDLAQGLLNLYAKRSATPGHAFPPDSPWQREFEESFEFEETDDQLTAAAEIKADMERPVPMDRLLCGDVGFGKTEVAFRAMMKCVTDGKQAALLVPTTVLARQHYLSALARWRGYPVNIAMLSRNLTPSECADTLKRLRQGETDIIIGTHRLLSKDVRFADLGLLVVDEEQRFGVAHKERLKELAIAADVLTLSATPIPRTLNMALSGVRDMSLLEESPPGRLPVMTYVLEYDREVVREAILRELARGGQVYYLHNRVETIDRAAAALKKMIPNARVIIGHGQMPPGELSSVMTAFSEGDADILVCTTIIESGLDIANVNTLIIEDADHFGLSQLHQLRGRVGRSARQAYAYLTFRPGRALSEISTKRLAAMRDFAEFGAGFKIAMRDLEIRGAGNLLGAEQSGHMLSVGYDMYLKLLEEAVADLKGEKLPEKTACLVDLKVDASIPERYVSSAVERMDLYRRIARIENAEDASDMLDELTDRFGDCPPPVERLIKVSLLRSKGEKLGITEISDRGGPVCFYLAKPDLAAVSRLSADPAWRGRVLFNAGERPHMALRLKGGDDRLSLAAAFLDALGA